MKTSKPKITRFSDVNEWVLMTLRGEARGMKIDATHPAEAGEYRIINSSVWTALYRSKKTETGCFHIQWGDKGVGPKMNYATARSIAMKALLETDHLYEVEFIRPQSAKDLSL